MVLDPTTYDLTPRAAAIVARLGGDPRFKLELPAAQLEIVSGPHDTVAGAAAELRAGREALVDAAGDVACFAGAGAHPFATVEGQLSGGARYERTAAEFGPIARRQVVFGLHVHVAMGGPERAVAVYNAMRSYLPEVAALAANAPFHGGRDTELASIRPKLAESLPRQGVPPAITSLAALAEELRWGIAAGTLLDRSQWWWEARLHATYGTVEVRAPDAQTTIADVAAVAAVIHALVVWLGQRYDDGERLTPAPSWRIAENRWSACRYGLEGWLADLQTGERVPARERWSALFDALAPIGAELRSSAELERARALLQANGAERQRAQARDGDLVGLVRWLAGRFLG